MARTARREVIGLLIEKQVPYTDAEADALVAQAKRLSNESGRTVRAEAEWLLSGDRESRLRDLRDKVAGVGELLAAISSDIEDLRTESGDDDGELATLVTSIAAACEPFTTPAGRPKAGAPPGEPGASAPAAAVPTPNTSVGRTLI